MPRPSVAFPRSYQRHLAVEQRKAVLAALRDRIGPEHTVGEVLDAAEALGWAEPMSELSLADLAAALLTPIGTASNAEASASEDDEAVEVDVPDDEPEAPARRGRGGKKKAAAKAAKAGAKKKASKASSKKVPTQASLKLEETGRGKKAAKAAATGKGGKKAGKKTGRGRRPAKVDFDEPMSLEEAAGVLVPLVKSLGEATMQDLEEQTEGGRRKLRFHIGQLVRHGYLLRHGMGRGTFYTVG